MARDCGDSPPSCQVLIYPVTSRQIDPAVWEACLDRDFLTADKMRWYWEQYLPSDASDLQYASVMDHPDFAYLPPAIVLLAEHDGLLEQGKAYVRKLKEGGNEVYEQIYAGMIHGFLDLPFKLPQQQLAVQRQYWVTSWSKARSLREMGLQKKFCY